MAADWMDAARWARERVARALRGPRRIAMIDRALHATLDFLIDCPTVRLQLSDAHDGVLPRWQTRLVHAHVASCKVCGPVADSLSATIANLHALRDEPAGES